MMREVLSESYMSELIWRSKSWASHGVKGFLPVCLCNNKMI